MKKILVDIDINLEIIARQLCRINKENYENERSWVSTQKEGDNK